MTYKSGPPIRRTSEASHALFPYDSQVKSLIHYSHTAYRAPPIRSPKLPQPRISASDAIKIDNHSDTRTFQVGKS
ncbi:hypothetical protein CEXT_758061 [Caerostris extrusa]|uniref:Uncharacterized protein n=1 Tax=Caerostris extrusa TaxID=172846 RepID=A0AAV4Y3F2_CAEEX|nr:hypothetical protein CEXT_758061 [Caerostris extrusa]